MNVEFSPSAKKEFDFSIAYYEDEALGLGKRFKKEIRTSIDMIIQFPTLYPIVTDDIRKCVTHTFPYTIYYAYRNQVIYVYALANHHQNPSTYMSRFSK